MTNAVSISLSKIGGNVGAGSTKMLPPLVVKISSLMQENGSIYYALWSDVPELTNGLADYWNS
jgi:hypothetical protein